MGRKKRNIIIFLFWLNDKGSQEWWRNFLLPPLFLSSVLVIQFHLYFFPLFPILVSLTQGLSFCQCIYLSLILAHICRCESLAVFPFAFGSGKKPWFFHRLSFSVLTEHWLFMTANSVTLCASLPPSLSPPSPFLIFTLSLPYFFETSLSFRCLFPPLTQGGSSSCLRTDCFAAAGIGLVNKTPVLLLGKRASQHNMYDHNSGYLFNSVIYLTQGEMELHATL